MAVKQWQTHEVIGTEDMQRLEDAAANNGAGVAQLALQIAPAYTKKAWHVGEYCMKDGVLYRCVVEIEEAEDWTEEHWESARLTSIYDTLVNVRAALGAETLKRGYLIQGYISNGVYASMISGADKSALIPVRGGERLRIAAPSVWTSVAALKSFDTPASGDAPDYSEADGWTATRTINGNTALEDTVPADARYLMIYLGKSTQGYGRAPVSVTVDGYDYAKTAADNIRDRAGLNSPAFTGAPTAPTPNAGDNSTKLATTAYVQAAAQGLAASMPRRIRIMQNNVGKFNLGYSIGTGRTQFYITSENKDEIFGNYADLLSRFAPDIIGMEEFQDSVLVKGENGASDETVSTNELLYNTLYPNHRETNNDSTCSIKLKETPAAIGATNIPVRYTWDEEDGARTNFRPITAEEAQELPTGSYVQFNVTVSHARIQHNGRQYFMIVGAFPTSGAYATEEEALFVKRLAYGNVIDWSSAFENVFIICDANALPAVQDALLSDVLAPAGFNTTLGGYLRPADRYAPTYQSNGYGDFRSIDNIFFKGDMILANYRVLADWRAKLASDHVPIYADFILP